MATVRGLTRDVARTLTSAGRLKKATGKKAIVGNGLMLAGSVVGLAGTVIGVGAKAIGKTAKVTVNTTSYVAKQSSKKRQMRRKAQIDLEKIEAKKEADLEVIRERNRTKQKERYQHEEDDYEEDEYEEDDYEEERPVRRPKKKSLAGTLGRKFRKMRQSFDEQRENLGVEDDDPHKEVVRPVIIRQESEEQEIGLAGVNEVRRANEQYYMTRQQENSEYLAQYGGGMGQQLSGFGQHKPGTIDAALRSSVNSIGEERLSQADSSFMEGLLNKAFSGSNIFCDWRYESDMDAVLITFDDTTPRYYIDKKGLYDEGMNNILVPDSSIILTKLFSEQNPRHYKAILCLVAFIEKLEMIESEPVYLVSYN